MAFHPSNKYVLYNNAKSTALNAKVEKKTPEGKLQRGGK